jgi:hypothetical protein
MREGKDKRWRFGCGAEWQTEAPTLLYGHTIRSTQRQAHEEAKLDIGKRPR